MYELKTSCGNKLRESAAGDVPAIAQSFNPLTTGAAYTRFFIFY